MLGFGDDPPLIARQNRRCFLTPSRRVRQFERVLSGQVRDFRSSALRSKGASQGVFKQKVMAGYVADFGFTRTGYGAFQ